MKRLRILTLLLFVLAYGLYSYRSSIEEPSFIAYSELIPDEWYKTEGEILTPKKERRKPDQTFLTFPEWFLVFSPEEQAKFFETNSSTDYPYRSQVNQFWEGYNILGQHIDNKYPYNEEYNTMIDVIGVSTEIEYDMKSWYETVIGRATKTRTLTEEDKFNQKYTAEYAASLNTAPWYDFDYKSQLKKLWTENSFFGANMHRKLERKYLLTSEMIVKIGYAELIKFSSESMYGATPTTTVIVADRYTDRMKNDKNIEFISSTENSYVLRIPRYTAFLYTTSDMAKEGVNIKEVAGNKTAILISLIASPETKFDKEKTRLLFGQKLSNETKKLRLVIVTPIEHLAEFIRYSKANDIMIEHVYDF